MESGPFAGKTKEEILGLATGQAYALEQANQMLQRFNQPVQQPQANAFDLDRELPDGEYVEAGKMKQIIRHLVSQSNTGDPTARNLAAQSVYANIRTQYADEYKRWGSEIDAEVRKLPVEYWTYDALTTIVKMVRANHLDELVADKAKRLNEESYPTIRSGSGGSGSGPQFQQTNLDSESVPKSWALAAKTAGITEAEVREFCDAVGITVEQYMADLTKFGKGAVIRG